VLENSIGRGYRLRMVKLQQLRQLVESTPGYQPRQGPEQLPGAKPALGDGDDDQGDTEPEPVA
jgi:hypothetical protein